VVDADSTPHLDSGPRRDAGPPPPEDSGPGQDHLSVKIDGVDVTPGPLSSSDMTTDSGETGVGIEISLDQTQTHLTDVTFYLPNRGEGTYVCGSLAPASLFPAIVYTVIDATTLSGTNWVSEVNDPNCTIKLTHYDLHGYIEGEVHGDVKHAGDPSKHVDSSFRLSHW
jgi:hypothetical protein